MTTDAPTQSDEIPQSILDEALLPDLSSDEFTLLGHTVKIKPLKVRHQIEFGAALEAFASDAAYEIQNGGYLQAVTTALGHVSVLPKLIAIMAKNDGKPITEEMILDSDMDVALLADPLIRFAYKNERLGKPVIDFFTAVLPVGKLEIQKLAAAAKAAVSRSTLDSTA